VDCFQHRINVTLDNYLSSFITMSCLHPIEKLNGYRKIKKYHLLYGNHRNKYIVNIMYIILRFILKYVKFMSSN